MMAFLLTATRHVQCLISCLFMEHYVIFQPYQKRRLTYQAAVSRKVVRGKAHATMWKVVMGNSGYYGCLIELQIVSAWRKETTQTRVFVLPPFLLLNRLKPQSSKALRLLPIIPIGIVECTFSRL